MASHDIPTFYVGDRFHAYKDFEDRLNARVMLTNEKIIKSESCQTVASVNRRNTKKLPLREDLEYRVAVLICRHGGVFKPRGDMIRRTKSAKMGCKFFIKLKVNEFENCLEVTELNLEHTHHVLSAEEELSISMRKRKRKSRRKESLAATPFLTSPKIYPSSSSLPYTSSPDTAESPHRLSSVKVETPRPLPPRVTVRTAHTSPGITPTSSISATPPSSEVTVVTAQTSSPGIPHPSSPIATEGSLHSPSPNITASFNPVPPQITPDQPEIESLLKFEELKSSIAKNSDDSASNFWIGMLPQIKELSRPRQRKFFQQVTNLLFSAMDEQEVEENKEDNSYIVYINNTFNNGTGITEKTEHSYSGPCS